MRPALPWIVAAALLTATLALTAAAQAPAGFDPTSIAAPGISGLPGGGVNQGLLQGPTQAQFPGQQSQFGQQPQGGTFFTSIGGVLPVAKTLQVEAFCNDLFAPPPSPKTLFAGATAGVVELPDGRSIGLSEALRIGLISVHGAPLPAFIGPSTRDQPLKLLVTNRSQLPIRLSAPLASSIVPVGKSAPTLHPRTGAMFAAAAGKGIRQPRIVQLALWASTGRTQTDVEQTQLGAVKPEEAKAVQALLDEGGVDLDFDRSADEYDQLYTQALQGLGGELRPLRGVAALPDGKPIAVDGFFNEKGEAVVTVTPKGSPQSYYFRGKWDETSSTNGELLLVQLKTRQPIYVYGGKLQVRLQS